MVGNFKIKSFPLKHDVPCSGFLIDHPETGSYVFLTDTWFCPYKFTGLSQIMIECNYDEAIMEENIMSGNLPEVVRRRVVQSHIELDVCKEFLLNSDLSMVVNIVLLHLSSGNSHARNFQSEITKLTGKNVVIADKGMSIDFNKEPF